MKKIIKISMIILLVFGMINFYTSNAQMISQYSVLEENNRQSIQYESHAPITIENNSDFALQVQNEGWDGDGSQEDPYIITGLEIDTIEPLITIKNTHVYFEISENLLSGTGTYGISLRNVTHGTIASNSFQNIHDSLKIINCANITISKNTISDSSGFGTIDLKNSLNINISGNTVITIHFYTSHNNSVSDNDFAGSTKGTHALSLEYSSNNLVSNNNIHGYVNGPGIVLLGSNSENVIKENVITNTRYGYFQDSGLANVINNNTFGGSSDGILYRGSDGIISHNYITGYGRDGISLGRRGVEPFSPDVGHAFSEFESAINTTLIENIIANNLRGIFLDDSQEATIMNNSIYSNSLYGLKCNSSAQNNLVKWNDFLDNNQDSLSQASDAGTGNTFNANYWFEWTSPDSESDGIVDKPYAIDGEAQNTDPTPRANPNPNSPNITVIPPNNAPGWNIIVSMIVLVTIVVFRRKKSIRSF